jgi:serine phosphatase RsbU (regulator of sigma subunit)
VLPTRPDLALAVRYLAGTAGIEVGGDWYDVIDVDERTVFFTVGDVAGKGLEAAILMASLRNAITAYATDGDAPGAVLSKIGRLVDVARDGRFATVVCGTIDLPTGRVTLANAGHPRPVLVGADHCGLVTGTVGPPVGVGPGGYPTATVDLRPGDTLLAYTDGLIERRGESLAAGLDRICGAAHYETPLERLLDDVIAELVPDGPPDDIAALGMRWQG